MKRTFKYLNDNRKKCLLGVETFHDCRVVSPGEVCTFELDLDDDDVIFIKTWKHDDKILVSKANKSVWEIQDEGNGTSS